MGYFHCFAVVGLLLSMTVTKFCLGVIEVTVTFDPPTPVIPGTMVIFKCDFALSENDSLNNLYWQKVVEGEDVRVCTYQPGSDPVREPDYVDNIPMGGFVIDKNNYFSMRFNVTTEDVGEYLCNVQSNSNDEGEDQSMINVIDDSTTTPTTTSAPVTTTTTTAVAEETTDEGSGEGENNGGASTLKLSFYSLLLIFMLML